MSNNNNDAVNEMMERMKPAATEVSFGGLMGFCSGMAFRRVGRAAGVVIGLGFMGAQAAASSGYLQIDWEKVKKDAVIDPLDAVRIRRRSYHLLIGCSFAR